jgi:hypothetical protein
MRQWILVSIIASLLPATLARADVAGTISEARGQVYIVGVDGAERPAKVGDQVMTGETVRTGSKGSVQVALADNSGELCVGSRATLDPGYFVRVFPNPPEPVPLWRRIFKWIGGAISTTAPEKVRLHTPSLPIGGIRGDASKPGPDFLASLVPEGDAWVGEVSVLSGAVKVDGVNHLLLPDRYFLDPLVKTCEGLNAAIVLADVTPDRDLVDLLGVGSPVIVEAGYWTRVAGGPPLPPQLGIAPSHVDADRDLTVAEPTTSALLTLAALLCGRCRRRSRRLPTRTFK